MFFAKKKKSSDTIDLANLPKHIAIIMDGNGRWAKKRGLPRSLGHREGAVTLKKISGYCDDIGIKYLTVYAFSTENWRRPKEEVDYIMELLVDYFRNVESHLGGKKIKIRVIGDMSKLSKEVLNEIENVKIKTDHYDGLTLTLAINYGSRDEITKAVGKILNDVKEGKIDPNMITEDMISERLYTYEMPDPDILVRPGGEKRTSNYLLWQTAYSEFWFDDCLWPDFTEGHLREAIKEFQNRNRRFGGI